jgi:hypothetical protein
MDRPPATRFWNSLNPCLTRPPVLRANGSLTLVTALAPVDSVRDGRPRLGRARIWSPSWFSPHVVDYYSYAHVVVHVYV